jgi:hypothetical protein
VSQLCTPMSWIIPTPGQQAVNYMLYVHGCLVYRLRLVRSY